MQKSTARILRIGLAFAILYPPLDALVDPYSWIGYFPPWMHGYVPDLVLLHAFGAVEIVIALWLLSGWKVFYPALAAMCLLLAIVFLIAPISRCSSATSRSPRSHSHSWSHIDRSGGSDHCLRRLM